MNYSGFVIYVREKHRFDRRTPQKLNVKSRHWFWGTILVRRKFTVCFTGITVDQYLWLPMLFVIMCMTGWCHWAFDTLWVLAIGAFIVFSFDFILKMVRSYFIDLAGKKSDILLSSIMECTVSRG